MLGRAERESPSHAAAAAALGGWSATAPDDAGPWDSAPAATEELLDLGGLTDTLSTVSALADLAAVVQIGNPAAPDPQIEDYLLRGDHRLMVVAAQAVPLQWVWAVPATNSLPSGGSAGGAPVAVALDDAALRDLRPVLQQLGVPLRVVPARASVSERVAAAGPGGSVIIERDRMPAWLAEAPTTALFAALAPVWFGLVGTPAALPAFEHPSQVWLAFQPSRDHRGSLREALSIFADLNLDLTHLRSQREPASAGGEPRPHHFYAAFSCPSDFILSSLLVVLDGRRIAKRVLAVIPGTDFDPAPAGLVPQW